MKAAMSKNVRESQSAIARTSRRPTTRLTIQLLGSHSVYLDGDPITPGKRGWELLILLLFRPTWSAGEIAQALGGDKRRADRAKSELREKLGDAAGDWLDGRRGQFRFATQPEVDYWDEPSTDEAAFDYYTERGDLLPAFTHIGIVADERERYHQKLYQITRNLIAQQTTEAEVAKLRQRAQQILPPDYLDSLPLAPSDRMVISEREDDSIEVRLRTLETHVLTGEVGASDAGSLTQIIDKLSQTAYRWQLASSNVVERVVLLVYALRRRLESDLDNIYVKVANLYHLASNHPAAVETLRPWLSDPRASANAFCTAALYNLDLGYITEADACFERAYTTAPTADFKLTVLEKRSIQLAQLRGSPYAAIRRAVDDAAKHPAFDVMSPGSRASVWCNAARAEGNPATALRLTQKGKQIDHEAENPNYECDLLRYARAAKETDLAKQYAGEVRELMQTPRPMGFRFTQMSLRAEQLVEMADQDPSSRHYRAHLEEAADLWTAIYEARRLRSNVPRMCGALLHQAGIARRLKAYASAYQYASTAYHLGGARRHDRLRHAGGAEGHRNQLARAVDDATRDRCETISKREADRIRRRYDPLLVPGETAA